MADAGSSVENEVAVRETKGEDDDCGEKESASKSNLMAPASMMAPCARTTARSIVFLSSRTLPGHGYRWSSAFASSVSCGHLKPMSAAYDCANDSANGTMSSGRSRNGGTTKVTPLSRKKRSDR